MAKVLLEDTRQHRDKHEAKHEWWAREGLALVRSKIAFGDYCLPPEVAVDTKASMQEVAQNIGGSTAEHNSFRRELIKAQEAGCHLYILVENDEGIRDLAGVRLWVNPRLIDSPKAITGERLARAMETMQERYGVTFLFCAPERAAAMIHYLLERGI